MALKANKAMNFVKGATKAFTKNADDYSNFAGRWKSATRSNAAKTVKTSKPIKTGGYAEPKPHVINASNPHHPKVDYDFDLNRMNSNKAINPAGKANQSANKGNAQSTKQTKTTASKSERTPSQSSQRTQQAQSSQASSSNPTNDNASKTKPSKLQGFLNDVDPRQNINDEYAYIANKRKTAKESYYAELVDQGFLSPEQAVSLNKHNIKMGEAFEKKANNGTVTRKDLFNDLAQDKAAMRGDAGNVTWVDRGMAATEMTEAYFKSGSKSRNMKRAGAAVGAYGAASYGVRKASGGTLTYNRDGRSDIAGVPFF